MKRLSVAVLSALLVVLGCGDSSRESRTPTSNEATDGSLHSTPTVIVDDRGGEVDSEVHYYDLGASDDLPPEVLDFIEEYGLQGGQGARDGALTSTVCPAYVGNGTFGAPCVEEVKIQTGGESGACPSVPCRFAFVIDAKSKPADLLSDACMWGFPGMPRHIAQRIVIWGTLTLDCASSVQITLTAEGATAAKLLFICNQCQVVPPPY